MDRRWSCLLRREVVKSGRIASAQDYVVRAAVHLRSVEPHDGSYGADPLRSLCKRTSGVSSRIHAGSGTTASTARESSSMGDVRSPL